MLILTPSPIDSISFNSNKSPIVKKHFSSANFKPFLENNLKISRNAWKNINFDTQSNRFHFFQFEKITHRENTLFSDRFGSFSSRYREILGKNVNFNTQSNRFHSLRSEKITYGEKTLFRRPKSTSVMIESNTLAQRLD